MDDEDQFFVDAVGAGYATAAGGSLDLRRKLRFICLRLPSIVLADVVLLYSDYLMSELEKRFAPILFSNTKLVYLVSKMFLFSFLAICFLLFTLNIRYAVRLYKIIALVGTPFLFTWLTTQIDQARQPAGVAVPLVLAVYSLCVPMTIALYDDFYANFIHDKYNILGRYISLRKQENVRNLITLLDSFLNHEASEGAQQAPAPQPANDNDNDQERSETAATADDKSRVRRYFILAYAALSFGLNETFVDKGGVERVRLNIMMLGLLMLLVYDLSTNLRQMLLRCRIQLRSLRRYVSQYGLDNLLAFNWSYRLRVPYLLRLYFFLKCIAFTVYFLHKSSGHLTTAKLVLYLRFLTLNLSNTIVSIAAVTSIVSLQFYLIGKIVSRFTTPSDADVEIRTHTGQRQRPQGRLDGDDLPAGDTYAIVFFLLCIQSDLSSLNRNIRVDTIFNILILTFSTFLHSFHTTLGGQIMSLSASSKPSWSIWKHMRVLSVFMAVVFLRFVSLYAFGVRLGGANWQPVMLNIELVVKTSVTLLIYALFMVDSRRITNAREKLLNNIPSSSSSSSGAPEASSSDAERIDELSDNFDDFIYVVKAFGHVTEFVVALFLFFNGAYILLYESYGAVRAIMMCMHAYFNIWCQAKGGWSAFKKRRTAIAKLKRLHIFNKDTFRQFKLKQLHPQASPNVRMGSADAATDHQRYHDENQFEKEYEAHTHELCAICYCQLKVHETRITYCSHFFHSICLRKWLYFQDTCPMCRQLVFATSSETPENLN